MRSAELHRAYIEATNAKPELIGWLRNIKAQLQADNQHLSGKTKEQRDVINDLLSGMAIQDGGLGKDVAKLKEKKRELEEELSHAMDINGDQEEERAGKTDAKRQELVKTNEALDKARKKKKKDARRAGKDSHKGGKWG